MNMKRFSLTRSAAAVMTVILAGTMMTACGGSKSSSGNNVVLEFRDGDYLTGKPYRVTANKGLRDISCSYGVLSKVNPVTAEEAGENEWFYVLPEDYFASYDLDYDRLKSYSERCRVTLSDGADMDIQKDIAITDPLTADQWHLYNIGQNPYGVTEDPVRGIDLNVIPAWRIILPEDKKQIDGSGVYVAVWDQPIDLNHEDLRERIYDPGIPGTDDFINTGLSLENLQEDPSSYHGTSVAGIIAASAMNKQGGRGVAFNARVTSFLYSASDSLTLDIKFHLLGTNQPPSLV